MTIVDPLKDAGYVVLSTSYEREAMSPLDDPDNIDLILITIALPGTNGIETARQAVARVRCSRRICGSHGDRMAKANPPAPCRRLAKPYSLEALREAVENLLDKTIG